MTRDWTTALLVGLAMLYAIVDALTQNRRLRAELACKTALVELLQTKLSVAYRRIGIPAVPRPVDVAVVEECTLDPAKVVDLFDRLRPRRR